MGKPVMGGWKNFKSGFGFGSRSSKFINADVSEPTLVTERSGKLEPIGKML
jgi:hypothetical protein